MGRQQRNQAWTVIGVSSIIALGLTGTMCYDMVSNQNNDNANAMNQYSQNQEPQSAVWPDQANSGPQCFTTNPGDTVYLLDNNGNVTSKKTYKNATHLCYPSAVQVIETPAGYTVQS